MTVSPTANAVPPAKTEPSASVLPSVAAPGSDPWNPPLMVAGWPAAALKAPRGAVRVGVLSNTPVLQGMPSGEI